MAGNGTQRGRQRGTEDLGNAVAGEGTTNQTTADRCLWGWDAAFKVLKNTPCVDGRKRDKEGQKTGHSGLALSY